MKPTRKQHEAGVKRLNKLFQWSTTSATSPRGGGKRGLARKRQKMARASRRRNRL